MQKYNLFLFDLDDTLLDFKASEQLSFFSTIKTLGQVHDIDNIFNHYKIENRKLWDQFENGLISKDFLKVERFKKTFETSGINLNPHEASELYLKNLPRSVVLMKDALEICKHFSQIGEIGIITNGIHNTQFQRIKNSPLAPFISFISVSEDCGYAKPDPRFFEHSVKMAQRFSKESTIIIGDRLETDVLGGINFQIDSCWLNSNNEISNESMKPTFEIKELIELKNIFHNK